MNGKVKFFDKTKGFGFIIAEDDKEYFVHISALPEGVTLEEDEQVTFDVVEGDRGPKAENVQVGGAAPAAEAEPEADASSDDGEDAA